MFHGRKKSKTFRRRTSDRLDRLRILLNIDLIAAVRVNDGKRVQELLAAGAYVEAYHSKGWKSLHWAAANNASTVAKILVKAGADVEAPDLHGQRPLHWAARNNATATAIVLIEAGADVNAADDKNYSPLHVAAERKHVKIVQILLEAGADPHNVRLRRRLTL